MLLDYIDYFRQLAVQQKDLRHDPSSESNDAKAGSAHFRTQTFKETITGSGSKYGTPILLLNIYAVDLSGESYDVDAIHSSGFAVLVRAENKLESGRNAALAQSEKIMLSLLKKIWKDHYGPENERCETPFEYFQFDKDQMDAIGPIDSNMYGWEISFSFRFHDRYDLSKYDSSYFLE